jgi:16S rRNA (guanine(1405)-N(7))-methyltransferase
MKIKMTQESLLDQLVEAVREGARYRDISVDLVRRVGEKELTRARSFKEAVKATRNKLHQVGGAYQEKPIPYARLQTELKTLPHDPHDPALQVFCRRVLLLHASTRERLPSLERFFNETLASLAPLHSVLDLACGLNPLAVPWMPLAPGASYFACDVYGDMVGFVGSFLAHLGLFGGTEVCDLLQSVPQPAVQVALLLKTIPCLEQVEKEIGLRFLADIRTSHILASFPAHSLGGHSKGMVQNYEAHFREMLSGQAWKVQRFEFPGELAFLIDK